MVRTPEHTGRFLGHVAEERLYALFHLVAFRGPRRGEACSQRRTDTRLDAGLITVPCVRSRETPDISVPADGCQWPRSPDRRGTGSRATESAETVVWRAREGA